MRGRQVLMETLAGHGVDYLFGNPGTTESPIIGSLQDYPHIRYVMALHEGVALGAASYYAQASGRVGVVNLHVAPGLGNALGMMYKHNMDVYRQRFGIQADRPYAHMDLTKPEISFVDIARGMGVAGARVTRPGDLPKALENAFSAGGPYLLDVVIEGKR